MLSLNREENVAQTREGQRREDTTQTGACLLFFVLPQPAPRFPLYASMYQLAQRQVLLGFSV